VDFFVGKKPTLADIVAFRFINSYWAPDYKTQAQDAVKAFPQLSKLHEAVGGLEGIKDYYAKKNQPKEPKTETAPDAPAQTTSS